MASTSEQRILFVDDDLNAQRTYKRMLARSGFLVDIAGSAADAIEMASHCEYAVVATDLNMPGASGLELIETLHPRAPLTTYMLVTAQAELDLPSRCHVDTISRIIQKPAGEEELVAAINRGIGQYVSRTSRQGVRSTRLKHVHVLVVEDSAADAALVEAMLTGGGRETFKLTVVGRLSEALDAVKEFRFDALLVDPSLPDARGLDVVSILKPAAPLTPIVVMSGIADEELATQVVQMGAQDYLPKADVTPSVLRRSLRFALERQAAQERLTHLAHHDQLTGLANRILFRDAAVRALRRARRQGSHPAVLVLDLDHFKIVNDTLGHDAGDRLLATVAERLLAAVRDIDTVARLGGDEFAILVEDVDCEEEHSLPAQRILDALSKPVLIAGAELVATTSIGIAVYPESGDTVDEMLKSADLAMYRAKDAGRNRYQFFDKKLHALALEKMQLERELRGALERGEFELHYQPQNRIGDDRLVCLEALIRWNHPRHGLVAPDRFIPLLEDLGLIVDVGEWVLQRSCEQIVAWQGKFDANLRVAVNVSGRQFDDPKFVGKIANAIASAGIDPGQLELEITEGLLMKDLDEAVKMLHQIKELGVRIAIDDFGTGYSRLAYLTRFPIDVLKIDRSVINTIGGREGDTIATAVIALGHTLGFEVLAEGVEDVAQLDFLRTHECDMFQGFLSSKPLAVGACSAWLGRETADDEIPSWLSKKAG